MKLFSLCAFALFSGGFATPIHPFQIVKRQNTTATDPLGQLGSIIESINPTLGQTVNGLISNLVSGIGDDAENGAQILQAIIEAAEDTIVAQVPDSIPAAFQSLTTIFATTPGNIFEQIFALIGNGFSPNLLEQLNVLITSSFSGQNSISNVNPDPPTPIYPYRDCRDADYSLTEQQLRQVIFIPPGFTYGAKPPVILVPGTGNTGYQTFSANYIPLLTGVDYADPVWLNIPNQLLMDTQINSEYIAYAINYINSITSRKASIISWSQGSPDTQWAMKYWISARNSVNKFIPHSADFRGTVLAFILCPAFPMIPCAPSVIQQEDSSNFIATLRADGGDSAYVPTTSVFSATDEIVQPQTPVEGASAFLNDARQVGVTNAQVQAVCGGKGPAGVFYTHEGMLYNPLAYALTVDTLTNDGPGSLDRINLPVVCAQFVSPGLSLVDVLATEEAIVIAALSIVLQPLAQRAILEPPIMNYALPGSIRSASCNTSSSTSSVSASSTSFSSASLSSIVSVSSVSALGSLVSSSSLSSPASSSSIASISFSSPSAVSSPASLVPAVSSTRSSTSSSSISVSKLSSKGSSSSLPVASPSSFSSFSVLSERSSRKISSSHYSAASATSAAQVSGAVPSAAITGSASTRSSALVAYRLSSSSASVQFSQGSRPSQSAISENHSSTSANVYPSSISKSQIAVSRSSAKPSSISASVSLVTASSVYSFRPSRSARPENYSSKSGNAHPTSVNNGQGAYSSSFAIPSSISISVSSITASSVNSSSSAYPTGGYGGGEHHGHGYGGHHWHHGHHDNGSGYDGQDDNGSGYDGQNDNGGDAHPHYPHNGYGSSQNGNEGGFQPPYSGNGDHHDRGTDSTASSPDQPASQKGKSCKNKKLHKHD